MSVLGTYATSFNNSLKTANIRPRFSASTGFLPELRVRVDAYFRNAGLHPHGSPRMYYKSAVVLSWLIGSYVALVFFATNLWLGLGLAISVGLAGAVMGFNIPHDGAHGAYSRRKWVNRLAALTMDMTGASSYVWSRKHNSIHHCYSNITGHDDDIDIGLLGRLSPHQRRLPFHRLQHIYLWLLYGLLPVKWLFFDDFWNVLRQRIGEHRIARPRGWDLVSFVGGKVVAFTLIFVLPLMFHSVWAVLLFYAVAAFAQGVVMSVVFQMAHCVEEASFPMPQAETGLIPSDWAKHQIQTTVNFARDNRLITWLTGGLNYQIEHHLFPQVCHIHYPALSRLVEATCADFGVRYRAHATFVAGVMSHFRWLRRLGSPRPILSV